MNTNKALPRGIRNKNPGNIDRTTPRTPWQGQLPAGQLTDERFEQFQAPEWGIRALARTLITYQDKHGLNTVRGVINRWAPPSENDTGAYVAQVASKLGVTPNTPINVHEHRFMLPLVKAIIHHENGMQPYTEAQLNAGLRLAGVVPAKSLPSEQPSVVKTKTGAGGVLQGVAGLGAAGGLIADNTDTGQELIATATAATGLAQPGTVLGLVLGVMVVVGLGLVLYGRWDARRKGGV